MESLENLLETLDNYQSSISVLSHLKVGEKVFYDYDTGVFSVSAVKSIVESVWGPGVISDLSQSVSRKLNGENCDTTVSAIMDFTEKMRTICERIQKLIASNHFSRPQTIDIKRKISPIISQIKGGNLSQGLANLKSTYPKKIDTPDRIGDSIFVLKKDMDRLSRLLEKIVKEINHPKKSQELIDLEKRIEYSKKRYSGEAVEVDAIEDEFIKVNINELN